MFRLNSFSTTSSVPTTRACLNSSSGSEYSWISSSPTVFTSRRSSAARRLWSAIRPSRSASLAMALARCFSSLVARLLAVRFCLAVAAVSTWTRAAISNSSTASAASAWDWYSAIKSPTSSSSVILNELGNLCGIAVRLVVDEDPHEVLRAQFVLGRQFAEVARGVDQKHLVLALGRTILPQNQQAGGESGAIEDVERE